MSASRWWRRGNLGPVVFVATLGRCVRARGRCVADPRQLVRTVAEQVALALANLKLRETLRQQSIRDPLTGLYNRHYLTEPLKRELARAARKELPLAVIMLDVDGFKQFNDTFGHDAGDVVLRDLGTLFRANVRESDVACRFGGEEFTFLLPETLLELACKCAEDLRQAAQQLHSNHGGQALGSISISLGGAVLPNHATDKLCCCR